VTGVEVIIGNCLLVCLAPLSKYGASKIVGLRPWLFAVTWRHQSCDHSTRGGRLPMGGPLWRCIYLAPIWPGTEVGHWSVVGRSICSQYYTDLIYFSLLC